MKLFIFLVGVTCSLTAPQGLPSFKISGFSRSNVPEMSVTFENGETHEMILEPYSETPCNFIGQLKNVPSSLAVTGCLNTPEDKMHITLLSQLNTGSAVYEMDYDGHVTAEENPFKYQKERSGIYPPSDRDDDTSAKCENDFFKPEGKDGDELEDLTLELEADIATSAATSWPSERYAYVKFGYDRTLKNQLSNDNTNFGSWIDSVMTHVQSYYRHPTLPTKIQFKYDKSEAIYKDRDMPSTTFLEDWALIGKQDGDAKIDLYAAFGKDSSYYGTIGLAYVGSACRTRYMTSFNEWRKTHAGTAFVVAHEMGHNFGMSHDFDNKHGGDNGPCDGQGIMSYGSAPLKWSSCSVSDFTGYYNLYKWGETCLASWDAYCGDKCPICNLRPNTICDNPDLYGGCNGRYKNIFKKNCAGTCGYC